MTGPELFDAGFKVFFSGVGVWALRAYLQNASVTPKASSGFMNLSDLQEHCKTVQSHCINQLDTRIQALADTVGARLKTGDQLLADHETRLRSIQVDLTKTIEKLKLDQNGNAERVAAEILKQIQKQKRKS